MRMRIASVLTGLAAAGAACQAAAAAEAPPGWHLVWEDEFEGEAVDPARWRVEHAALVKNNELQFYASDDVDVRDGRLVLRSQARPLGGRQYTSGLVETKGKFAQAFGRFEVRAKLPGGQGIWPAHWLLPTDGGWPPELDIMELLGHEPNTVYLTQHWGAWPNNRLGGEPFTGPDFTQDFHTFALEWEPDEIRWYVDGELRHRSREHVPTVPCFLILNTAVGGDWPGPPDETTVFPQFHEIDYVRVYARDTGDSFILTMWADHGRILHTPPGPRYEAGDVVTMLARPSIGYRFARWSGDAEGARNPSTVTMTAHRSVRAHFEPDPHGPALLSAGARATASSVEPHPELALGAAMASDGDPQTRWSSAFSDPQWIMLDLGERRVIEGIRLNWELAYGKAYDLQVSDDGEAWRTAYATRQGAGGLEDITIMPSTSARYVRLYGRARGTQFGYSLLEFEVYGR
ncbi:MAG TPA: family 16 glycosylhydrolase [bacterium]